MCFALQRRARFQHLNVEKCSKTVSFWHVWLRSVLRATTPRPFSTSQLPKVLRPHCAFHILTSKCASCHCAVHFFNIFASKSAPSMRCFWHLTSTCASRHNDVQFLISYLTKWLRTRRFSKPTFRPSGAPKHWKNTVFLTFLPVRAPASSFFWLTLLFSDLLSYSLLFSDSSHLCFVICPYCRKFDF